MWTLFQWGLTFVVFMIELDFHDMDTMGAHL